MPAYRLFCLDGTHHIESAHVIEAETDEEALMKARDLEPCASIREVWLNDRLIRRMNSTDR